MNEPRNATYKRLSALAASSIGVNENEFYDLLKISDKPGEDGSLNSGNQVTNDLKVLVKMNRMQGVHVTPTVVFNGVVENNIASSFSAEDWEKVRNDLCPNRTRLTICSGSRRISCKRNYCDLEASYKAQSAYER